MKIVNKYYRLTTGVKLSTTVFILTISIWSAESSKDPPLTSPSNEVIYSVLMNLNLWGTEKETKILMHSRSYLFRNNPINNQ